MRFAPKIQLFREDLKRAIDEVCEKHNMKLDAEIQGIATDLNNEEKHGYVMFFGRGNVSFEPRHKD